MQVLFLVLTMLISIFTFSGCSILPRITFDKAGVTPTSTEKSQKDERCAGEYKLDSNGNMISCSKGYINKQSNYHQAERKYTLAEKVANFIRGLAGWGFWGLAIALLLVPGLAGWLIGRIYNVFHSALNGTVAAISKFRKNIPTITVNSATGNIEIPDPTYVKAVDALLDELETQHSADKNVIRTISEIRLKLKIEDND